MNLIIESPLETHTFTGYELDESTGKQEKSYYVQGIFSTPDKKNRNGRIYSRAIWEREVAKYQEEIKNKTTNSLCEWEHPARTNVDPINAVGRCVSLQLENNLVVGKIKILNNDSQITKQIKALIDEGIKIGVSSRGVGTVGTGGIVTEFTLSTYDLVSTPSDWNASLNGICEGLVFNGGIAVNAEYFVNESGVIVQSKYTPAEAYKLKNEILEIIKGL